MRTLVCLLAASLTAFAQANPVLSVAPNARFEVATIKPGTPGENAGIRILVAFTRVETANTSVTDLIKYAYNVHPGQIIGGPDDLMHRGYALQATITAEKPNADVLKQMLRNLLIDRFHLAFHHETRDLPVYILSADTGTPHLTATRQEFAFPTGGYGNGLLAVHHGTTHDLALYLQRFVTNRPVVDRTGISGAYDIELHFTPDDTTPSASATSTPDYPNLYTAIREQLGLRLTAAKAPVDVLVIDTVTEPTEN